MASTISTFTTGDLVVSISGNGDGSGTYTDNQASPLVLDELTTGGSVAGSLVLSQATSLSATGTTEYAISAEYGSSSEGLLQLSADGRSLVIAGYGVNAAQYNANTSQYGTAALAQTTSLQGGSVTAVARVIADIGANGTVDTSTALYNVDNTNNPRSVATVNGTSFYLSGQGVKGDTTQGVDLAQDGASSATIIDDSTDTRSVEIQNGQLYVSRDSKQGPTASISSYGTTLPTAATASTTLPGIANTITLAAAQENSVNAADVGKKVFLSPESYFFANPTTLYVADSGNPKQDTKTAGLADGGLQKWSYNGSAWVLDYTLSTGLTLVSDGAAAGTTGLIGLTGTVTGNTVTLYATNATLGDTDPTFVYGITDTLSATAASAGQSFTTLFTAAPDTNVRGIAFAPSASVPCYASGTRILTARGEVAVEDLAIGDSVMALLGRGMAPIRWIGSRTLDLRTHPAPALVQPVRIRAGAFAPGQPHRDLVVSPGHAVFVDGVLIQAERLVNATSIVQEQRERVTYWHVELERHDVLLAEGLPAESYLDTGNRADFAEDVVTALHPDFAPRHAAQGCAPLVQDGPVLAAVKARLLARAQAAFGAAATTDDAALHLLADGVALAGEADAAGWHRFDVPAGVRTLRLTSRRWVPAHALAASTDTRELGVCVRALRLDGAAVALDDARLGEGWHAAEAGALRWTRGDATLPGASVVEVRVDGFAMYPVDAPARSVAA